MCCLTRKNDLEEDEDASKYGGWIVQIFRNVHAPLLLSKAGKAIVLLAFSGLLGFGIYVSSYSFNPLVFTTSCLNTIILM